MVRAFRPALAALAALALALPLAGGRGLAASDAGTVAPAATGTIPAAPPAAGNAPGVVVQRQALVKYRHHPDGTLDLSVWDPAGRVPVGVDKLTLSAISEDNGTPIRAELHATADNAFTGDLSVPDGGYNLDLRLEKGGKPLTGAHLVSWRGVEDDGVFALTAPNLSEINRITLIVALSLGIPVGLALLAVAWGIVQNRRKDREAAPLDLPLPGSGD